jgi:glycosyltransferase involved in cell wall biosynthesis
VFNSPEPDTHVKDRTEKTGPSHPEQPRVSIVLPCRNEADMIERCLESVLRQEPPTGGMEIIIAEGMSEDGTRDIIARWKEASEGRRPQVNGVIIRVIENPGRIASMGLNAAIRAATGNIIIRMDAHTEFAPDYVRQCVAQMQTTGADNVGGPARTKPVTYIESAIAAAYHSPFSVGGARFHDLGYEGYVDTVTYGCWRPETFKRFGYFDEELVRNQDDEHNLRIIRGGGEIWQSPKIRS